MVYQTRGAKRAPGPPGCNALFPPGKPITPAGRQDISSCRPELGGAGEQGMLLQQGRNLGSSQGALIHVQACRTTASSCVLLAEAVWHHMVPLL